jgi:riboflavin synthase
MADKKPGDRVNVEVDMVGKYALKSLEGAMGNEGVEALLKRLLAKQ